MIKEIETPPYIIDKKTLKRFNQRQTIFGRKLHDTRSDFYKIGMYDNTSNVISENKVGYSRIDFAQMIGSWTLYDYFNDAFSWDKLTEVDPIMDKPIFKKLIINNKEKISEVVKDTAVYFGAYSVGITRVNDFWIYSNDRDNNPIEIPKDCNFAIIMTVKMDGSAIKKSPSYASGKATGLAYSKMAFLGLLITPDYGPCVRICKVFTDLPMKLDKPITFGVTDFCRNCRKCSEACEADAIQTAKEPSFGTQCPSNNTGILRWAVNQDKCYKFWIENGGECSNCIAACPYFINKN
jgi:ferredoxin